MEQYVNCKVGGLANVANTCYLNSAIQCLAHNLKFLDAVLKYPNPTGLFKELQELLELLWFQNCSVVPHKFVSCLRKECKEILQIHDQNDVQEFLIFFIDHLNRSISKPVNQELIEKKKQLVSEATTQISKLRRSIDLHWWQSHAKEHSPMIDLFYGTSVSQIKCLECKHISHSYEIYSNISVSLDHKDLESNISKLFEPEQLSHDAKCEKCKATQLVKSNKLWTLPQVLIVLLKRFDALTMTKQNAQISVPDELDMAAFSISDTESKYKLQSIACHSGSMNSGHYCAACKHPSGSWCIYDDDSIIPIKGYQAVNSGLYYVLFYQKV